MLDAFHSAAVCSRNELREKLIVAADYSKPLIKAILAQYDGNVDGAVRILRHQLVRVKQQDSAYVADMLAPIFIMRHQNPEARKLARMLGEAGWAASAEAFHALADADDGNRETAQRHFDAAASALEEEADPIIQFRVTQRLARAAFLLHDYAKAVDLALSSAALAASLGAWRASAAGYSIAYSVHYNVTGNVSETDRFASLWHAAAVRSDDASFIQAALVAEYEIAVNLADGPRIERLRATLDARLLPQQYRESFPLILSHAIVLGATDLIAMRTLLQILRDVPDRTRGEWALCTALIAVADASVVDDDRVRDGTRDAVSRLGRGSSLDPAYEKRFRRLARGALAAACVIISDDVRADRIVSALEARQGTERVYRLPELTRTSQWEKVDASLRGLTNVIARAVQTRRQHEVPAGLTPAEFAVLRLLANGLSAGMIAKATERSVNTVYNHTRAILGKLEATRTAEAVAIARKRGFLT
jgi:DNA-binding CsgD family transcriptional regulator